MQAVIFREDLMSNDSQESRRGLPIGALSITEVIPHLLRTIVRLLVGTISYPVLTEILKAIYVEEGEKKLIRSGSKPTKSGLALITGMDTRVVSAVLANGCDTTINPQQISPKYTLIDTWGSDPFFMDHSTEGPAILPVEGRGKTFQSLVLKAIGRNKPLKRYWTDY